MSNLALTNKDDYPDAAAKHLEDAGALIGAERFDGAGYLVGYVIECSLRTVVMIGHLARLGRVRHDALAAELDPSSPTLRRFKKVAAQEARAAGRAHDLDELADATTGYKDELNAANAMYAPPIDKKKPLLGGTWTESIRYRAQGDVSKSDAETWLQEAEVVYQSTIGKMVRNGLIRK